MTYHFLRKTENTIILVEKIYNNIVMIRNLKRRINFKALGKKNQSMTENENLKINLNWNINHFDRISYHT